MKVAVVHEWLVNYAGSERVLEQMLQVYPEADLFSVIDFLPKEQRSFLMNKQVNTTFIQKLPWAKSKYRYYLPFMPLAIEQFDLAGYDLVISSSHAVAKGVLTGPDQLHISYVHTPVRYAWDLQHQYLKESGLDKGLKGWLTKRMLHKIRLWDYRTANGVDAFIANSKFIAKRIWKVYRRDAVVIYPPVDTDRFSLWETKEDYYLAVSRMVPYKKMDLIVNAFSQMPDQKLVVIGDGPDYQKIRATGSKNIQFLGYQPFSVLKEYMQRAKAFVFAAEEDFGIVPVEAQACGTPVIAYGKGGALETVQDLNTPSPTGLFFYEQTPAAIINAVKQFEQVRENILPQACRKNAERFATHRFRQEFQNFVKQQYAAFKSLS